MKPLRVLSIDWDYFVDATMEQRVTMFPDGGNENLGAYLQDVVWSTHYTVHPQQKRVLDIGVDQKAYKNMIRLLNKTYSKHTFVAVADSHKALYKAVVEHFDKTKHNGIELFNVDFHHDYYGLSVQNDGFESEYKEVDCGNWANALFDEDSSYTPLKCTDTRKYVWVKRQDSDTSDTLESQDWFEYMSMKQLCEQQEPYDIIFLCRSSMWSPPHLDKKFYDLCKNICTYTQLSEMQKYMPNRYNHKFVAMVEQQQAMTDEIMSKATGGV